MQIEGWESTFARLENVSYQNVNAERHYKSCHQKVCDRQGDNKVVGNVLQHPLADNANYHQHIAEHHLEQIVLFF